MFRKLFALVFFSFIAAAAVNGQKTLALDFNNSLANAVAAVGSTKMRLIIDKDTSVTTVTTIPENVSLELQNGARIVKSAGGKINCAGDCLAEPLGDAAIFVNFAPGDIIFTGANYPRQISTALWDNAEASARINAADRALIGKSAEIFATAGNLRERVIVNDNHALRLGFGEFSNAVGEHELATFSLGDNTAVTGKGIGLTVVRESSTQDITAIGLFYSRSVQISGANGRNTNITISDLTIAGADNIPPNQTKGAIQLGNVENAYVQRVHFKNVHGYGAYVGGHGGEGFYAKNCFITDNIFENVGSQNAGGINVDGLFVERNLFIEDNNRINTNAAMVDVELDATTPAERVANISVSGNIFKTGVPNVNRLVDAIKINSYGTRGGKQIRIVDNQIVGWTQGTTANNGRGFNYAIFVNSIESIQISGNTINGTNNVGLWMQDVASANVENNTFTAVGNFNSTYGWYLIGVTNSIFRNNSFPLIRGDAEKATEPVTGGVHFGSSKQIIELNRRFNATFSTANGVSTAIVGANTTNGAQTYPYDWWLGKTVTVEAASGINAGTYTITAIDFPNRKITLGGSVGSGTAAAAVNLANNLFIDNLSAEYNVLAGSLTISTAVKYEQDWTVTVAGTLNATGDVAWKYFSESAKLNGYSYKCRTFPSGGTQTAIVKAAVTDIYQKIIAARDISILPSGEGADYVVSNVNLNIPAGSYLKITLARAAAGGTLPANCTLTLNYSR